MVCILVGPETLLVLGRITITGRDLIMKSLITIPLLILFFAVSTFGNFIVGYCPPPECTQVVEPENCGPRGCGTTETESSPCEQARSKSSPCGQTEANGCGPVQRTTKPIPIQQCSSEQRENSVPVRARTLLPIFLAFDPTAIPCCARVCTTHGLSDFREEPKSDPQPLDLIVAGDQDIVVANLDYKIPVHSSRPLGVHPIISTTILRL